jgi:hypothetical protein
MKIFLVTGALVLLSSLVFGSFFSSNFVFKAYAQQPPASGFHTAGACGYSYGSNWSAESCCWKEGGRVSPEYTVCQTCFTYSHPFHAFNCGFPYTPFTLPGSGPITGPLGGGVVLGSPNILPFDFRDILTMPENQSYSVSVQHGPNSDTIKIEIPKALSNSILNQTNLNQTTTGLSVK